MKAGVRKTIEGLKNYMEKHGYTGLLYPCECGCSIDNLAPCGEDYSGCTLGYVIEPNEEERKEYEFMVTSKKPKEEK